MNPLKLSMNIDLIHWILVLLGGDLYQEYLIFSIWKPLWRKTWEEYIEPCCAKAPWKSQGARKWIKDIYIYLMMFWLCLITCEYVQHAFLIIIGYTLTRPFCTNIKCSFTLKKIILTLLLRDCNFILLYCGWGLADTLLHISQFVLPQVLDTFLKELVI